VGKYAKAILAFLTAGLGALGTAAAGPDNLITWAEIFTSIGAGVVAATAVFSVSNAGFLNIEKLPPPVVLAQEAYEAYAQAVGGRSVAGEPLPTWAAMTATVKDAWARAQGAVLALIRQQ
jgi:hypothetical protein